MKNLFKPYNTISEKELFAVKRVIKSGILSGYQGANNYEFMGGKEVKKFESSCEKFFKVKYAIAVNSWTSGLICAFGAIDLKPGDEVITTPWTMSACTSSIIHWGGIPIFADIDKDTYCIDPLKINNLITKRTKAVLSVDIFGQSANIEKINKIAKKNNIFHISDSAQAPGSIRKGYYAGTKSHIGGISLNKHKHIQTGEGGIIFTNNEKLAQKMRLIRNHAESVVDFKSKNIVNLVGYNFRLGELESAIGLEQLKKLKKLKSHRTKIGNFLNKKLSKLNGLQTPVVEKGNNHIYYLYPLQLDLNKIKVSREKIIKNLEIAGVPKLLVGYQNLHLLPMFQKKIAYGSKSFPWSYSDINYDYAKGICPVAENLHDKSFFGILFCNYEIQIDELNLIVKAFNNVWNKLGLNI